MSSDRIYSILTAFPAMMLIVGLIYYYKAEEDQATGELIVEQSEKIHGSFKGFSGVSPNSRQFYLWINTATRVRGFRILPGQLQALSSSFTVGQELVVWAAPRVEGSKTLWVENVFVTGKDSHQNVSKGKHYRHF